jgi:2'-phosphotransferase
VDDELLLTPIYDPFEWNLVIHGTYREPMPLIMQGGLNKMARNHIHMAPGIGKNNVISGMRGNCEVVIEVNMAKAMFGPD